MKTPKNRMNDELRPEYDLGQLHKEKYVDPVRVDAKRF